MPENDAIDMLKQDHEKVGELLDQLTRASSGNKRTDLLQEIKKELTIHSMLEEELFYPAFDKESDTKEGHVTVLEAREEHALVDQMLEELEAEDPDSEEFQAKARLLKELVEHHVEEEEEEMLPKARDVMSNKRLNALSEDMAARKQELMENYEEEIKAR